VKKLAIFASGGGTNAQKIIEYFYRDKQVEVSLIVSNKPNAYVITRAKNNNIPTFLIDRESFYENRDIGGELRKYNIDYIILAGFLWLIPEYLIDLYPDKIINIHPALLPKYGGKGMYGIHVHRAVRENNEPFSGISIHYVNQKYDEGELIFQASTKINATDSPYEIAEKVQKLEHKYFPMVIEAIVKKTKLEIKNQD
jgi:phosphoribosylglycinamide formyltransferase-1